MLKKLDAPDKSRGSQGPSLVPAQKRGSESDSGTFVVRVKITLIIQRGPASSSCRGIRMGNRYTSSGVCRKGNHLRQSS